MGYLIIFIMKAEIHQPELIINNEISPGSIMFNWWYATIIFIIIIIYFDGMGICV